MILRRSASFFLTGYAHPGQASASSETPTRLHSGHEMSPINDDIGRIEHPAKGESMTTATDTWIALTLEEAQELARLEETEASAPAEPGIRDLLSYHRGLMRGALIGFGGGLIAAALATAALWSWGWLA